MLILLPLPRLAILIVIVVYFIAFSFILCHAHRQSRWRSPLKPCDEFPLALIVYKTQIM